MSEELYKIYELSFKELLLKYNDEINDDFRKMIKPIEETHKKFNQFIMALTGKFEIISESYKIDLENGIDIALNALKNKNIGGAESALLTLKGKIKNLRDI